MKKILILGASEFQIPLVLQARKMGLRTCVIDYNKNAPAVEFADDYFQCSLKDILRIVDFAREYLPDGVTVGMCDVAVVAAAEVSAALGLPGLTPEIARRATDKFEMVQAFEEAGVPHPLFVRMSDIGSIDDFSGVKYPIIAKPIDMSGSRGIRIIQSEAELVESVRYSMGISDRGEVLLEEYMIGPEVSVEILVLGGQPNVLQVTDKLTSGAPSFMEIGHSQPSVLPSESVNAIKEVACAAVRAIGIETGFAHAEIILTGEGPKMVEIGARMGGDGIQQYLIGLSTGLNLQEIAIRLSFGEGLTAIPPIYTGTASAIRFLSSVPGKVVSLEGFDKAAKMQGVFLAKAACRVGDTFGESQDNSCRFGFVVARADSPELAIKYCQEALEEVEVGIE